MKQEFKLQKQTQLAREDSSYIGRIDKEIKKLVELINSKKEYYTTSSCSGRIILIKEKEKKESNLFLWIKHGKINFEELKEKLKKIAGKIKKDIIYLKQEPCILHIACKTLEDAQILLDKAKFAGWKNSGIIATKNRIILQLISTERMDSPVIDRGKILISDETLKILIEEANKKLERTRGKIRKFENLL